MTSTTSQTTPQPLPTDNHHASAQSDAHYFDLPLDLTISPQQVLIELLAEIAPSFIKQTPQVVFNTANMLYHSANRVIQAPLALVNPQNWSNRPSRLESLPNTEQATALLKDISSWINTMLKTPSDASEQSWQQLTQLLEKNDNLNCLNHLIQGLTSGDQLETLLEPLPDNIKNLVRAQYSQLKNSPLIRYANLLMTTASERTQLGIAKSIPNVISRMVINQIRNEYFPNNQIPLQSLLASIDVESAVESANTDSTRMITAEEIPEPTIDLTEISAPQNVNSSTLSDAELDKLSEQLWLVTADLLEAAKTKKPDPATLFSPITKQLPVSPEEQASDLKAVIKKHLPLFETLIAQPDFNNTLEAVLTKATLPPSMINQTKTNLEQELGNNKGMRSMLETFRHVATELKDHVDDAGKLALVDNIPTEYFTRMTHHLNTMLTSMDPMELDFYKQFTEKLCNALSKLKPIQKVAERLTKKYFKSMSNNIEFQRKIALAVLKQGKNATLKDRLKAIGLEAGIGFQKGMQLFSNKIDDEDIQDALSGLKQSITPMPQAKSINIIKEQLTLLNSEDPNRRIKILLNEDGSLKLSDPKHSATIGQVHKATIKITINGLTEIAEVAIKVQRDGSRELFETERDGLQLALQPDENEENYDQQTNEAIAQTISELMEGIEAEFDFRKGENNNARIAEQMYHGERKGVKLRAAGPIAATDKIIIQRWAPGKSIDANWKELEQAHADAFSDDPAINKGKTVDDALKEKLEFLVDIQSALELELITWVSSFANGTRIDAGKQLYLDSDRHDGNSNYDRLTKTLTMLDFGAGIELTKRDNKDFINMAAAISNGNVHYTYNCLAKMIPQLPYSPKDSKVLQQIEKALSTRHTRDERVNEILSNAKMPTDSVRLIESSDNKSSRKILNGRVGQLGRFKPASMKLRTQSAAIIKQAKQLPEVQYNKVMADSIRRAVLNPAKAAVNPWNIRSPLSDEYNDIFLIKTLEKIASGLGEAGYPASQLIILVNRGSMFMSDKIKANNVRIESLKETILSTSGDEDLKREAMKLYETNIGNQYARALAPKGMAMLGSMVYSQANWVGNKMMGR